MGSLPAAKLQTDPRSVSISPAKQNTWSGSVQKLLRITPGQHGPLGPHDNPTQVWKSVCTCGGIATLNAAWAFQHRSVFPGQKRWLWEHCQAALTMLVPIAPWAAKSNEIISQQAPS